MKPLVVIETVGANGTEWGVSFDGCSPEAENYVAVRSEADAVRLKALVESRDAEFISWHAHGAGFDTEIMPNGEVRGPQPLTKGMAL